MWVVVVGFGFAFGFLITSGCGGVVVNSALLEWGFGGCGGLRGLM